MAREDKDQLLQVGGITAWKVRKRGDTIIFSHRVYMPWGGYPGHVGGQRGHNNNPSFLGRLKLKFGKYPAIHTNYIISQSTNL